MAPKRAKDAAMVLLKPRSSPSSLLFPCCSRCLSIATGSLPADRARCNTTRRQPARAPRLAPTPQRRNYAAARQPSSKKYDPYPWLREGQRVDPSVPFEVDPSIPLPADGMDIAIIGGGLAGLTTAFYMASNVRPSTKITLYEASPRLGGWIRTDKVPVNVGGKQGIVNFERGPRSLSALAKSKSRFDDLIFYDMCIKLGLKPKVAPNQPRYIYYPDHLVRMPESLSDLLSQFFTEEVWQNTLPGAALGYLKHVLTGRPPPKDADVSISEFVRHITGKNSTVPDHLVSAVMHGIYGGDIDQLSARVALYPHLDQMRLNHRGAPRGEIEMTMADYVVAICHVGDKAVRRMAKDVADQKGALLHFGSEGLQVLPDALEAALRNQPNVEIKTSTPVVKMEHLRKNEKIRVVEKTNSSRRFDKVFSTVSARQLERMVPGKLPTLKQLDSVSIMAVNLWFPEPNLKPPGFGYLIPRSVSMELNPHGALGVFFDSDIGNNHPEEPEGTKLFVLMGGHHYKNGIPVPTPEEAVRQARELLEHHLGIPASLPCHAEANFNSDCIPQHNVGHMDRMEALLAEVRTEFNDRLVPIGGAISRIGGMAAIRDGWIAGTQGFDTSKPVGRKVMEKGLGVYSASHMYLGTPVMTPLHESFIAPVRPALQRNPPNWDVGATISPDIPESVVEAFRWVRQKIRD